MTDAMIERTKALETLAKAAVAYFRGGLRAEDYKALLDAVDRLPDPLPAATPGEVVEADVWEDTMGEVMTVRAGSFRARQLTDLEGQGWTRLGTTRLPLVKETRDAG